VTKIGALGTTQAATSNRRTLRRNTHGVTTQKTPFFMFIVVLSTFLSIALYMNGVEEETSMQHPTAEGAEKILVV
jgi:hypothetical protein